MKLYLSSNRLGNKVDELKKMILEPKRIAVITNAKDYAPIELKSEKLESNFAELKAIGFDPIEVDLRKYFDQKDKLADDLR